MKPRFRSGLFFRLLRTTRKTELPSASVTRVFPACLVARTTPFALLRYTRKTELPSAPVTRVFPAFLVARTTPFALLSKFRLLRHDSPLFQMDEPLGEPASQPGFESGCTAV